MTAALDLRFRETDDGETPPDVDAFAPRRREVPARMPGVPVRVFFQYAGYGIPALHVGERPLDLASWSLRPTAFGFLAQIDPPRGRAPQRTAWVLGAFLPLVIATEVAAAAAPAKVQRPKKATAPEPPPLPDPEPEPEPPPTTDEPPPPEPITTPPEPPPTTDPFVASPPAVLDERAIRDAAWEGVDGFDVDVTLKAGDILRGRVGAVQRDTFTLIQDGTGAVLVLSKSGVRSLRVRIEKKVAIPSRTGTGALVGGSILTAVGTPTFIAGLVIVAACGSCASIHLPLLLVGGAALGGGIPLLVKGTRLREKYRSALLERGLSAYIGPTRQGWGGGLRFRF